MNIVIMNDDTLLGFVPWCGVPVVSFSVKCWFGSFYLYPTLRDQWLGV